MAQVKKFEGQTEVKSHADKVFDLWTCKLPQISKLCPDKLPKFELHEGDWHLSGSVITWHYLVDGKRECGKTKVEIDEMNKSVTYELIDGSAMNYYKSINAKIQVIPKTEGCNMIFTYLYEKIDDSVPEPNMYLNFLIGCAKDVDARLCAA